MSNLPDICIGDFAENLLKKGNIAQVTTSEKPDADIPNIESIQVSEDFVNTLVGKSPEKVSTPNKIETTTEERLKDLIGRLSSLIQEAKDIIKETTTCGAIGVPISAPPLKTKKKVKKRRRTVEEIIKDVLAEKESR